MSKFSTSFLARQRLTQPAAGTHSSSAMHSRPADTVDNNRLTELEVEEHSPPPVSSRSCSSKTSSSRAQGSTS